MAVKEMLKKYDINQSKIDNHTLHIRFIKEYDKWDKKDREGSFILGKTSIALQSIGLNNRNIVMDKSKILKIKNDHPEMTDNIIKQIPVILENPIIILNSESKSNINNSRIVIFGDVIDFNNKPVLVAMELNPNEKTKENVDKVYKVASAYGKEKISVIQNWLNIEKNILYVDKNKKRTINWLDGLGLQLPVPSNNGSLESNISQSKDNVNYFVEEEPVLYEKIKNSISYVCDNFNYI